MSVARAAAAATMRVLVVSVLAFMIVRLVFLSLTSESNARLRSSETESRQLDEELREIRKDRVERSLSGSRPFPKGEKSSSGR